MKIAFILSHGIIVSTDGVVSQAKTWKRLLESRGHEVVLINMWENNDWKSFDAIHFFSFSVYMRDLIMWLSTINPNICVSPILDPKCSPVQLSFYSRWGSNKLGLYNPYFSLSAVKNQIKLWFVRSEFEKMYFVRGYKISEEKIIIVPLSYNLTPTETSIIRENFCLHISLLVDDRKNVKRLIEAAKKYKFKLVLGGKLRNEVERTLLSRWIEDAENIEYKGYLSNEQMTDLYLRAKVFALPSTNEGVGIVALDAAAMGCDIVITSLGGPKEYYNGMAKIVNPYSVDEIGTAITQLLNGETYQPCLSNHICDIYSTQNIAQQLETSFNSLFK